MTTLNFHSRYYRLHPPEHYAGHAFVDETVDLGRTALLVVDVYGQGLNADDELRHHPAMDSGKDKLWTENALQHVAPTIAAARRAGLPVIYVSNSSPHIEFNHSQFGQVINRALNTDIEDLLSEPIGDPLEYNRRDNHFIEYSKALAPCPGDYYVRKHFYSGFKDTRLDTLLRNLDIKTLICVGYSGDVCLFCTLIDAMELNYQVVLLRDCTRSTEIPEDEGGQISYTERMVIWIESYAGTSITSAEFVEALQHADLTPGAQNLVLRQ
jgi:nicotinamidase-related amidase